MPFHARSLIPDCSHALVAGLMMVLGGLSVAGVRAEQPKTVKDGVYTDTQATRGEGLYGQQCASCHAADLSGSGAPALVGKDFLGVWDEMSVADLAEKIVTSMPPSAPGSIAPGQASDLVAFILKSNNFPSGADELDLGAVAVSTIRIVE